MKPTRLLVASHRWLGCLCGPLVLLWILSGAVMLFARMPREFSSPAEQLNLLPPLDWAQVRLSFQEAAQRTPAGASLYRIDLEMLLDQPVYRLVHDGGQTVLSARTGIRFSGLDQASGRRLAARLQRGAVQSCTSLNQPDQWTVGTGSKPDAFPLLRCSLADTEKTVIYLSQPQGSILHASTRKERLLSWLGAIPHWLYLPLLRQHPDCWRRLIIGLSGVCLLLPITGLLLWWQGRRPEGCGRGPLQRLHIMQGSRSRHLRQGLLWGGFLLTFTLSGLLSLPIFGWPQASISGKQLPTDLRPLLGSSPLEPLATDPASLARSAPWARRVSLHRFLTTLVLTAPAPAGTAQARTSLGRQESYHQLLARLKPLVPVASWQALCTSDGYLPAAAFPAATAVVLRVKLSDSQQSWLYLDPIQQRLILSLSRAERIHRWLYRFLHCLDLPVLAQQELIRKALLLLLLAGGAVVCLSGWWSLATRRRSKCRDDPPQPSMQISVPRDVPTAKEATHGH